MAHRTHFRALARARLRDAGVLLDAGQWSGAYYLAGYAVECGLKAAAAKQFTSNTIPDKNLVNKIWTHDLELLVRLAGLGVAHAAASATDPDFDLNWQIVKDWNESARYSEWREPEARELVDAIRHRRHGVMRWVRSVW